MSTSTKPQVIAVAGVGNLGKYICDELRKAPDFDVIVLTRKVPKNPPFSRAIALQTPFLPSVQTPL